MAGEFDNIKRYFAPLSGPEGLALKDDAACIPAKEGFDTIVTKDVLVAGTHFFETDAAADIAFKALSVNVSDLVAKGADPAHYFVGLSLPQSVEEDWIAAFSKGLGEAQTAYHLMLAGGDTTKTSGPVTISITAIGYLPNGCMVQRSTAKVGDIIYVTGFLGRSTAALRLMEGGHNVSSELAQAYLRPHARIDCRKIIRDFASASADISDGILADLGHICDASAVKATVEYSAIPVDESTRNVIGSLQLQPETVWSGGDDYELVFTIPQSLEPAMLEHAEQSGVAFHKIGHIASGKGVEVVDQKGNLVQVSSIGYQHFC